MTLHGLTDEKLVALLAAIKVSDKTEGHNVHPNPNVVGAPVTIIAPTTEENDSRIRKFLEQPIKAVEEKYKGIRLVTHNMSSVDAWSDTQPGQRLVYNLYWLNKEQIIVMGADVFASIRSKVTVQAVGKLILLAYNLTTNAGARVFSNIPFTLYNGETMEEFEEAPKRVIKNVIPCNEMVVHRSADEEEMRRQLSIGYCYLACSYMRLYTKSAENFTKIEKHLKLRFQNFYDFQLPFENYHPPAEAIISIKSQLELNEKFKNTFYNLLYAGEAKKEGRNLKNFLYTMHVSFTGLHPFTLFIRNMVELNVSNRYLAAVLYVKKFEVELKAISGIFDNLCDETKEGYELQMWRFARIFENRFLSDLQTKKCQLFTLVLAFLLNTVAPLTHQDVLKIAQISNASDTQKSLGKAFALTAYKMITDDQLSERVTGIKGPNGHLR